MPQNIADLRAQIAAHLGHGVLATSQGTMNNFTFGNARDPYDESLSGGSGAGPAFGRTDVEQTHMTNSRLTDPEVLEWRFPVRLARFEIRPIRAAVGAIAVATARSGV